MSEAAMRDEHEEPSPDRVRVKRMNVKELTLELARHAGELLGTNGFTSEAAIDAVVAATALSEPRPVVILTSDPKDLGALTQGEPGVSVASV